MTSTVWKTLSLDELSSLKNVVKQERREFLTVTNKWVIQNFEFNDQTRTSPAFAMKKYNNNIKWELSLTTPTSVDNNFKDLKVSIKFLDKTNVLQYFWNTYILNKDSKNKEFFTMYNSIDSLLITDVYEKLADYLFLNKTIVIICQIGFILEPNLKAKCRNLLNYLPMPLEPNVKSIKNDKDNESIAESEERKNIDFLKEQFNDFKNLLEDKKFFDITLKSNDDQELKCHKIILAARSTVFSKMFSEEPKLNLVEINDIEHEVLEILINFLYTGEHEEFDNETATKVLKAAHKYNVQGLKFKCQEILLNNMSIDNAVKNLILSDSLGLDDIRKSCISLIVNNLNNFSTSEFKTITNPNLLAEILGKISLNN